MHILDFSSWNPLEAMNTVMENQLQVTGKHVHLGHGEVHHVGVGVF